MSEFKFEDGWIKNPGYMPFPDELNDDSKVDIVLGGKGRKMTVRENTIPRTWNWDIIENCLNITHFRVRKPSSKYTTWPPEEERDMPLDGEVEVEVVLRCGDVHRGKVHRFFWNTCVGYQYRIVGYRIVGPTYADENEPPVSKGDGYMSDGSLDCSWENGFVMNRSPHGMTDLPARLLASDAAGTRPYCWLVNLNDDNNRVVFTDATGVEHNSKIPMIVPVRKKQTVEFHDNDVVKSSCGKHGVVSLLITDDQYDVYWSDGAISEYNIDYEHMAGREVESILNVSK